MNWLGKATPSLQPYMQLHLSFTSIIGTHTISVYTSHHANIESPLPLPLGAQQQRPAAMVSTPTTTSSSKRSTEGDENAERKARRNASEAPK